jgi:hypothetical protein
LEWRRHHKIDAIRDDFKPPEVLKQYFSASLVGRDKMQSPRKQIQTCFSFLIQSLKVTNFFLTPKNFQCG